MERGSLLADIWAGYSAMVDAVNGSLQVGLRDKAELQLGMQKCAPWTLNCPAH